MGSHNGSDWKGPQWDFWSNLPAQVGSSQSRCHRIVSRRVLNTSSEEDSTCSMGTICQCLVTHTGKKFSLISVKFSPHIILLISWERIPRSVREAKPPTVLPSDSKLDFISVKFALSFHCCYIISVDFVFSPTSSEAIFKAKTYFSKLVLWIVNSGIRPMTP